MLIDEMRVVCVTGIGYCDEIVLFHILPGWLSNNLYGSLDRHIMIVLLCRNPNLKRGTDDRKIKGYSVSFF